MVKLGSIIWGCLRLVRILPVLLFPLLMAWAPACAWGADGGRPRRVLMVHSFGGSAPPFASQATAFASAIKQELGAAVDLDQVSLDYPRYYAHPEMDEAFEDFLKERLDNDKRKPDLVVSTGPPAGKFVAKFRNKLFPGIPVIYSWVSQQALPADALANNATFVGQSFDLKDLVDDMLQLDPETNNVVVILGATTLERYWSEQYQKAFEPFAGRVKFKWVNDLSFDEIRDVVSTLPPHSFVLHLLLLRDASGITFNQEDVLQRLNAVSSAPVNGLFRSQVGHGIVGGRLFPDELLGQETARVAARILRGEPASNFPPMVIPMSTPTYDWRELGRWGFNDSRLPAASVVLFRQPTAWELYRWPVAGVLAIFVTQAALISALLVQRRRRNLAERAQKQAQAEVQQKRAQLEHVARVATLGELTANLTHELTQPLSAIAVGSSLGIDYLNAPQPDLQDIRRAFSRIGDTTRRAIEMIQGMRDMLKRDTPGFTNLDLNHLIHSVKRIAYGDAILHGVTVDVHLSHGIPLVQGDSVQLQQVMMNLMLNAFSAMSFERGERRLLLLTKPMNGNVLVEVQDTGTGIPAEKLEKIFDPFFTTKPDGLGLGLSICRSIIERHGGKIRAANNPDRGATFSFTLPATRPYA